jgi:broad specificity phosphatase PhoE
MPRQATRRVTFLQYYDLNDTCCVPSWIKLILQLAAYGHEQAEQLATFLSSPSALAPHPAPEKVFTSPFYRCIETSVPTAKALGMVRDGEDVKGKTYEGIRLEHGVQEWYVGQILRSCSTSAEAIKKHLVWQIDVIAIIGI